MAQYTALLFSQPNRYNILISELYRCWQGEIVTFVQRFSPFIFILFVHIK